MAQSTIPSIEAYICLEFKNVIKQLNGDEEATKDWTTSLIASFTEPQRHYHSTTHIHSMLQCLDSRRHLTNNATAVQLAIFFHDWVYIPEADDNELQSIARFQIFANQLNIPDSLRIRVCHYIEATITHSMCPKDESDEDLKLFLDLDLEVLARDRRAYERYAAQIRQEYCHLSGTEYITGRLGVLQRFLARERLFFTEGFVEVYESRARENLQWEIEELKEALRKSPTS